ncbi:MAG: EAL domain-containing protein [Spirochaetales bacterium]|nr:EAL domain-containing protein [Spirochaetales bacterium]
MIDKDYKKINNSLKQTIKDKEKYIEYLEQVIVSQFNTILLSDKARMDADQTVKAYEMVQQLSENEIKDRDNIIKAHENLMQLSAQELIHKDRILNTILETNQYICTIIEENEVLNKTLTNLVKALRFKRGILFLEKNEELSGEIYYGMDEGELKKDYFSFPLGHIAHVREKRKSVILKNSRISINGQATIISIVCLPLVYQNDFLGLIYIDTIGEEIQLSSHDLETAHIFGTQASISVNSVLIYKALKEQSIIDKFTGLPNRKKLEIDLETPGAKTIALLNIDGFSTINVAYGIEAGNHVLLTMVRRLKEIMPPQTQLYRLSADEFVVLSWNKDFTPGLIKTSIKNHIANSSIEYRKILININLSIGIVHDEEKELLRKADIALKAARKKGRGYVVIYDETLNEIKKYKETFFWINKVKKAVRQDKMIPYFQGIHNNTTGAIDIYECLVRIVDQDENIIPPRKFLEPAKQLGLYSTVSYCMIDKTFQYFEGRRIVFSINLSDEDFTDEKLLDYISYKLNKHNIVPQNVVFEIVENFSLKSIEISLDFIKKLKSLGVKIAIDDFGSEFSNFSRLLSIDADYIKIDSDFIMNINTDKNSYKIAQSITNFSHSIGARVIAEYVHSNPIQEKVLELGIDYSQGNLFGEPVNHIDAVAI